MFEVVFISWSAPAFTSGLVSTAWAPSWDDRTRVELDSLSLTLVALLSLEVILAKLSARSWLCKRLFGRQKLERQGMEDHFKYWQARKATTEITAMIKLNSLTVQKVNWNPVLLSYVSIVPVMCWWISTSPSERLETLGILELSQALCTLIESHVLIFVDRD